MRHMRRGRGYSRSVICISITDLNIRILVHASGLSDNLVLPVSFLH